MAATVDSGADTLLVGASGDTVTFSSLANAGTVEVTAGTLDVTGAVSGGGTTQIDAGATFEIGSTDADPVTFNGTGGTFVIDHASTADGGDYTGTIGGSAGDFVSGDTIDLKDVSYTLGTASATVTFAGGTGELVLNDPADFSASATISGFTGTASNLASSDAIDLVGIDHNSAGFTESYDAATGLLTVSDGTHTASLDFVAFNGTFDFASDGRTGADAGTLIFDPPAASPAEPSVLTSATTTATSDSVSGSLSFAETDPASAISASFTPDGSNDQGSFTLDQPTASNGIVAVGFEFMTNDGHASLTAGQVETQSYSVTVADAQNPAATTTQTVSVTIGGPGDDHFVFAPGVGADTVVNFNAQQDTLEFDHFANVQTAQELQALITTDAHGDAVINLGHHDSVTLVGVTDAQLQHIIQAGHVLLH